MPGRYALTLVACMVASTLGILAMAPFAHAATRLPGADCPLPSAVVPWHYVPDGCVVIGRNGSATLPRAATEIDVWSANGRTHLVQIRDTYPGMRQCPQWGFEARGYAVGWVTCNRDVFNYARAVIAYYWQG